MPLFALIVAATLWTSGASAQSISQIEWGMLLPSDDWTAQVLRGVFPAIGQPEGQGEVANQRTILGFIVGLLTGFVCMLAVAWVIYSTSVQLMRVGYERRVMSDTVSPWSPVRTALAVLLMFPVSGGTSVGQALVMQGAMGAIGMVRLVWAESVKAIGADAVPIAIPMIPGTKTVVSGLMQNEMCRALITAAAANMEFAPVPRPVTGGSADGGGYVMWPYRLAIGNATGAPVCGTVTIRQPAGQSTLHGVNIDMTPRQQAILEEVSSGIIRPAAERMAMQLWDTREPSALAPMRDVYVQAVDRYTAELTSAATEITQQLRAAVTAERLRNGGAGDRNADRLSALGWTGAGAYSLELGRLNGATMSVLASTPIVNGPNYENLGSNLSSDLKPLMSAVFAWQQALTTHAQTTDGRDVPGGYGDLFSGASPGDDGHGIVERIFRSMRLNERLMNTFIQAVSPAQQMWQDPMQAQIQLGHKLMIAAIAALGMAAALASTPLAAGVVAANALTLNFTGAAAAATGYMAVQFLATPLWYLCLGLLVPGMILAYVLPMLPFFFWTARVLGWVIMVIELIVCVPLWMAAHITYRGEGLHGRGLQGYAQLFGVLVTPTLSLIGLFAAYVIYQAGAWLLQMTFGVAAGFVLMNGWLVTNLVGVIVLCCSFVVCHVVLTTQAFRMISIVPHHAVRLLGFDSANRVDTDSAAAQMGVVGLASTLQATQAALISTTDAMREHSQRSAAAAPRSIAGPMDGTTNAATKVVGRSPDA